MASCARNYSSTPGCFFHTHRLWAAKLQIIFYYRITKSENFMYLWTKVALFHHVSGFIGCLRYCREPFTKVITT